MRWSYKTVHYELKKEGLLGSTFLDESEIELSFNEYGRAGWELMSILETMDGIIAVFKQPLSGDSSPLFQINPAENDHNKMLQEEDPASLEIFTRDEVNVEKEKEPPMLDQFEIVEEDPKGEEAVEEQSPGTGRTVGSIRIE